MFGIGLDTGALSARTPELNDKTSINENIEVSLLFFNFISPFIKIIM